MDVTGDKTDIIFIAAEKFRIILINFQDKLIYIILGSDIVISCIVLFDKTGITFKVVKLSNLLVLIGF